MTKNERHIIYVQALIEYKNNCNYIGLCGAIRMALEHFNEYAIKPSPYSEIHAYLEISKYKTNGGFWFPIDNTNIRIEILEQAIEDTK